uniref:Synergin gamma n=1 Tax=Leptobrachium leishanense TaxID=445787 RepID=A0A8C5M455_9ANUR
MWKMALQPGPGGRGGLGGPGGGFMFPVAAGISQPQGMIPMQQQPHGFPMVPVMQPGMQNMMGVNYGSQIPQGTLTIQGGVPIGQMQTAMQFMGQPFLGMRPPGPQYTPDMQKQFVEGQQKRFEQQQKMLEEERKRRQFEEQKQKLRLLSSVKPKHYEKSRDDALEAIKGNLDGFSRDAKMHPTPMLQTKKPVGVGLFPTSENIQPMLPPWIYNDNLIPELYKAVLEASMAPTGIDTAKLYPILMSSGLPRETLGQIWALANRTMPGKLTKEELYTVLSLIAITQRGGSPGSTDVLSQFASPPIPSLSGFPMTLATTPNTRCMAAPVSALPNPVTIGPPVMAMRSTPSTGVAGTPYTSMPSFPAQQRVKSEDDDFQDFQDASKSAPIDVSFSEFQSDISMKQVSSQAGISVQPLLIPMSGTVETATTSADKYAVFKAINLDTNIENTATFADFGDKYHALRELVKPTESRTLGENFADIKSSGADDGFTDFKTADSISPLDPPAKDTPFPSQFFSVKQKSQTPSSLADFDLFSSVTGSATTSSLNFTTTFTSSNSTPFIVPPPSSSSCSSVPTSSITSKMSVMPDDFGEFSLFGDPANTSSVSGPNDFADFIAFNKDIGSSDKNLDGKPKVAKPEPSPLPGPLSTMARVGQRIQPPSAAHDKYDIFKQLSLESSTLAYDENKYPATSMKNDDDFADFQSDKFTITETGSEKSFVDKIASFKQTKEDSTSVKSLDLPSIGGSSVGKEDSEDALSIQFDMKLTDVGGDLKHVMSDSSLDLPSVSGQHPPAADEFKGNGSAPNNLSSYDWLEKDNSVNQSKTQSSIFYGLDSGSSHSSTSIFQKKETSFGSSENITLTSVSKVTTFSSEEHLQENVLPSRTSAKVFSEDLNSDLFRTEPEHFSIGLEQVTNGLENNFSSAASEKGADDFGEFQREKPKISKFDFLLATTQGKVKSSEEMIKNELATLDLCVQGSHKRSLSLGDKEISRSLPVPEQPFRDRSNTLSEKSVLPVIRDKYKDLTGEVEESERYAYEWQRCLDSALQVIKKANDTLNGISSSSVCTEVIQSVQGMEYLLGVVEVYRVTKRVELGIKATAVCNEKLQILLKEIDKVWNNLISFMSLAALMAFNSETDSFKLSYGGHQYHASCANFWINCVEPKPPGLFLPDLL